MRVHRHIKQRPNWKLSIQKQRSGYWQRLGTGGRMGRGKERRGDVVRSGKRDIFIILLVNTSKMRGLLQWKEMGTISLRMRDFDCSRAYR